MNMLFLITHWGFCKLDKTLTDVATAVQQLKFVFAQPVKFNFKLWRIFPEKGHLYEKLTSLLTVYD